MTKKVENKILLPPVCTILYAQTLLDQLKEFYLKKLSVEIDAAQVSKLSTAVFQILLSACKSYEALGMSIKIVNPSAYFIDTCHILGAQQILTFSKGDA
jgi:anti-anti-sigma regulatory factor